jgi:hypothetical protein
LKLNSWPLETLPGLSQAELTQLQALGVVTTEDLLRVGRSPQQLLALSQQLNLPLRYLQKWYVLAALAQLPSVGTQYCGLLLHCGITTSAQLANTPPGKLHSQIRRLHTMTMQRSDLCPSPDLVVVWIQEARHLQRYRNPSAQR